ncbi:UNVERIFIED_CONTAM: hypothetical protein Sangu_1020400 [Sesamum angustifolium]|uniref:Uncharacterized protein n=1 Tax=Sesamum angustifolium TaxID=2727405 RepID=A0AAW2NXK0_9LAMI
MVDAEVWKYFDQMHPDFTEEPRNIRTMVIPDPSNLKRLINVYLESLIEELLQLCHMGVRTYDHAMDKAFMMRAVLMWTVNNLPAYEMTSGWSTAGLWYVRSV